VLVTVILDNLAKGLGRDKILRSYPTLELANIDAALAYVAELACRSASSPSGPREVQARREPPGRVAGRPSGPLAAMGPGTPSSRSACASFAAAAPESA